MEIDDVIAKIERDGRSQFGPSTVDVGKVVAAYRSEYLRAERAIRSLKALQDGAAIALAVVPDEGPVADFLAAIHRETVRGQLASDEVTNECASSDQAHLRSAP